MDLTFWGFNAHTFVFIATAVFALLGVITHNKQNKKIWTNPEASGASIPTQMYASMIGFFIAMAIYGYSRRDPALLINSLPRLPFVLLILIGLFKFKGYTKKDWVALVIWVGLALSMFFSEAKGILFVAMSFGAVFYAAQQPLLLFRTKDRGVVAIEFFVVTAVSGLFWIAYGYFAKDTAIIWSVIPLTSMNFLAILLWLIYPQKTILEN